MYNRYDSKLQAKASMRGAYPHPMLVALIFTLATSIVSLVVFAVVGNPFEAMMYAIIGDLAGEYDAMDAIFSSFTPIRMGIFYLLNIIISLYIWVMQFGYFSYSLRLARGEQPSYRNLLDGFATIGKALLVNFFITLFALLWGMLGLVPMAVLIPVGIFTQNAAAFVVGYLLVIVAIVLEIMAVYRYRLAIYFLLDNPGMGVLESIRRSKEAMRGHKGTLFIQDLSFLGWLMLAPFTLGILGLWLTPYMAVTDANFYDFVVHGEFGPPKKTLGQNGSLNQDDRPELTF